MKDALKYRLFTGIIIITDGVTSVPDVAVCETLLNQLRSGTVACSFVQVCLPLAGSVLLPARGKEVGWCPEGERGLL